MIQLDVMGCNVAIDSRGRQHDPVRPQGWQGLYGEHRAMFLPFGAGDHTNFHLLAAGDIELRPQSTLFLTLAGGQAVDPCGPNCPRASARPATPLGLWGGEPRFVPSPCEVPLEVFGELVGSLHWILSHPPSSPRYLKQ